MRREQEQKTGSAAAKKVDANEKCFISNEPNVLRTHHDNDRVTGHNNFANWWDQLIRRLICIQEVQGNLASHIHRLLQGNEGGRVNPLKNKAKSNHKHSTTDRKTPYSFPLPWGGGQWAPPWVLRRGLGMDLAKASQR